MILTAVIKALLLPPGLQLGLLLVGFLLWKPYRWLANGCLLVGVLSLWALSAPFISSSLHIWLESPYPAATPTDAPPGVAAIVVLGAGRHYQALEYGDDTVSHAALWRLRYAGYLAQQWDLPIIVSGGSVHAFERLPEAALAATFLQEELGINTVWQEDQSRTTWENAHYTQRLLQEKNIQRVALVTHGYHMRRSAYAFTRAGIAFAAMPTGLISNQATARRWQHWLPRATALQQSRLALHEYLGLLFYHMK